MLKLITYMVKNLKLLMRSKISAFLLLFGPLLLILLIGVAYSSSGIYDLKIAAYSESYSELSDSLIAHLEDDNYKIIKVASQIECENSIKTGAYHVCTVFPPDMRVESADAKEIQFFVDESRKNLVFLMINSIGEKIDLKSSELSLVLTVRIVDALTSTRDNIDGYIAQMKELRSNTGESSNNLEEVEDILGDLNFSYEVNLTNFDLLDQKIFEINLSGPDFDEVDDNLDKIKSHTNSLKKQIDGLKSGRDKSLNNINEIIVSLGTLSSSLTTMIGALTVNAKTIDSIQVKDAESIVSPITTKIVPISANKSHLYYLFPNLVVMLIMFISLLLGAILVIRERTSKAYFRNFITPSGGFFSMLATYLSILIIIFMQLILVYGVSWFFFKEDLLLMLPLSAFILFFVSTLFILGGLFIGLIAGTEEGATIASISAGSVLLFFSNTILPLEALPLKFRQYIMYNPYVMAQDLLRKVMLFQPTFVEILKNHYITFGMVGVMLILVIIGWKLAKR